MSKSMNHSELYFTTGEFAKILGVKKHTLFHYDEMGLLSPAVKEENGYRQYFLWQTDVFEVIKVLQKLGMPLKEIKEYMAKRSPEHFMAMMEEKEAEIDREIERLKNIKRFVQSEKNNIGEALKAEVDTPRLVQRKTEYLLVSHISAQDEKKATVEIAEHMRMQERYHGIMGGIGFIYLKENLQGGSYDRCVKVYTKLNAKPDKRVEPDKIAKRVGGSYVEMYHQGYTWNRKKVYDLIYGFAAERGLAPGEMWYEELILDELSVRRYEDYMVKVVVPVRDA